MNEGAEVVSKSDFAKLCKVVPGRVTQWISEGKISGEAIVGEGRSAKINVDIACRQIALRRDVGQALGNGLTTHLSPATSAPTEIREDLDVHHVDPLATDDVDRKLKLSKLEASERANRIAAIEEAATNGLYTETASARAEMGKIAGQMIRTFEGGLPEMATAIAAEFHLDGRDVVLFINDQFRKLREQAAAAAAAALQDASGDLSTS